MGNSCTTVSSPLIVLQHLKCSEPAWTQGARSGCLVWVSSWVSVFHKHVWFLIVEIMEALHEGGQVSSQYLSLAKALIDI